jgi:hypothetical protein
MINGVFLIAGNMNAENSPAKNVKKLDKIDEKQFLCPFQSFSLYLWKDIKKHAQEHITEIGKVNDTKHADKRVLTFL